MLPDDDLLLVLLREVNADPADEGLGEWLRETAASMGAPPTLAAVDQALAQHRREFARRRSYRRR